MPATLGEGGQVVVPEIVVDTIKIVNHQVEDNVEKWIDIYYVLGSMVGGEFVQYFDPVTFVGIPVKRVKLEIGSHPLVPGTALRKCPACGKWFQLEEMCDVCEDQLVPYDGLIRAMYWGAEDPEHYIDGTICPRNVTKRALYEFLMTEQVPDPDNWPALCPLIDVVVWE